MHMLATELPVEGSVCVSASKSLANHGTLMSMSEYNERERTNYIYEGNS